MIILCLPAYVSTNICDNLTCNQLCYNLTFSQSLYNIKQTSMEAIKESINDLTELFNNRMADFQRDLKSSIPATSPTSNINAQFGSFCSFVLTALENLQRQVEILGRQYDELEMRSRKKMLLVHGISEDNESLSVAVTSTLSKYLHLDLTSETFSRCHRLGRLSTGKPRAVLIKFKDTTIKDKVWSLKTKLKGTGVTVSEFLTKSRHKVFLAARQRFGISKCWTRDGVITVLGSDSTRHRVVTFSDLNGISSAVQDVPVSDDPPAAAAVLTEARKVPRVLNTRAKKTVKK